MPKRATPVTLSEREQEALVQITSQNRAGLPKAINSCTTPPLGGYTVEKVLPSRPKTSGTVASRQMPTPTRY